MQVGICHFVLTTGGRVVHSYGRLIPHEFPITDLQQISGPDGIGRITCIVSSGTAGFAANGGQLETGGVSQTTNGATATLVVNSSNVDRFQNRDLYCNNFNSFFYLFISSASKFPQYYYIMYYTKQNNAHPTTDSHLPNDMVIITTCNANTSALLSEEILFTLQKRFQFLQYIYTHMAEYS